LSRVNFGKIVFLMINIDSGIYSFIYSNRKEKVEFN